METSSECRENQPPGQPPRAGRPTQRATVLSTRHRILDEALGLFLSGGYAASSLRMIADRVGITQAAVYYHFHAKDGLLAELLEPVLAGFSSLLDAAEGRRAAELSVDRRALLGDVLDHVCEHRDVVRLIESDVVVRQHPRWRSQIEVSGQRCRSLLSGMPADLADVDGAPEPDAGAELLASAAMAVVLRSVLHYPQWREIPVELLLDAAVRVLDTPLRARRHQQA